MITTRQVMVNLDKKQVKLEHVTTKAINVNPKIEKAPEKPKKVTIVSTGKMADIKDIEEKRRRDAIMAERKKEVFHSPIVSFKKNEGLEKLNRQFVLADIDDLIQGIPRRELK